MSGNGSERLQITLSKTIAERLQTMAEERGLSKSALVAVLVDQEWRKCREVGG